ncbi:MAG: hypothetical protein KDK10_17535 [Maritimibacter sp.]|nr:hypothetical protein [Maritimibacter sp.]
MQQSFSDCVLLKWQPGINDPYVLSWIMVAIYALAAALALAVAHRAPFPAETRRRERVFWIVVAIVAAVLAVNKQADLQTLLLAAGGCVMRAQGWADETIWLKGGATLALIALALGIGGGGLWSLRRTSRRTALPLAGLALMAGFIAFRALEILFFRGPLRALSLSDWPDRVLELSGPAVVIVGAWLLLNGRSGVGAARSYPKV